jgi:hypothetical protein
MAKAALYAYVQTRLQARHGERPGEEDWRRLRSIGDFGNYLQVAQRSSLNVWVVGMGVNTSAHEIELLLRQRFRSYIDELSRWLGGDWHAAVAWARRLIDLPALNHILSGQPPANWMLDDPELKPFIHVNENLRDDAFMESDCRVFLQAWKKQESLTDAWFREWQLLSPLERHQQSGLNQITRLFAEKIRSQCESPDDNTGLAREALELELRGAFRRLAGRPEMIFAHLGLVAIDIEKLRGDLVRRSLFQVDVGAVS